MNSMFNNPAPNLRVRLFIRI
ncbi:unnamed protein product, partial [Rotaria sp. Silwood1]